MRIGKSKAPNHQDINQNTSRNPKKPTFWQILISVLGALVGVQSSRVQERDFEHGHPWWIYAAVWLLLVIILILGLVYLTKWIVTTHL